MLPTAQLGVAALPSADAFFAEQPSSLLMGVADQGVIADQLANTTAPELATNPASATAFTLVAVAEDVYGNVQPILQVSTASNGRPDHPFI